MDERPWALGRRGSRASVLSWALSRPRDLHPLGLQVRVAEDVGGPVHRHLPATVLHSGLLLPCGENDAFGADDIELQVWWWWGVSGAGFDWEEAEFFTMSQV